MKKKDVLSSALNDSVTFTFVVFGWIFIVVFVASNSFIIGLLAQLLVFVVITSTCYRSELRKAKDKEAALPTIVRIIKDNTILLAQESMKKPEYYIDEVHSRGSRQYGVEKWLKDFIDNVLLSQLKGKDRTAYDEYELKCLIRERIEQIQLDYMISIGYYDSMTPLMFETFCKRRLERCGWTVSLTPQSGDQGVDLLAQKDGLQVAIQCKKYSKSVGNRAVQEIIAGAMYYNISQMAVVTTSQYTNPAHDLALSANVKLIHYSELESLYDMLIKG